MLGCFLKITRKIIKKQIMHHTSLIYFHFSWYQVINWIFFHKMSNYFWQSIIMVDTLFVYLFIQSVPPKALLYHLPQLYHFFLQCTGTASLPSVKSWDLSIIQLNFTSSILMSLTFLIFLIESVAHFAEYACSLILSFRFFLLYTLGVDESSSEDDLVLL